MASSPPPPYPPTGSPYGPVDSRAWKYQRRIMRDQAKTQRDQYRYQMRAMRQRSILGPVLAVAIGTVFLLVQTRHIAHYRIWELYGRWWPLLLVLGGSVLLIEWAVDQFRPHDSQMPYARRSVGGGVITLVILLAIAGAVTNGIHDHLHDGSDFFARGLSIDSDNFAEFMGSKHESDQSLDEMFPAGGILTIDNPHGDVTISGTSNDGRIHVSVHKQVYSNSDAEAERKARELAPQMTGNGKFLSVTFPSQGGATTDATITIPSAVMLTIRANHGDVHVDGMQGGITVTANHGDVALSDIAGAVVAHGNHNGSSFSAHGVTGSLSFEGRAQDLTLSDIGGTVNLSGDFYGTTHLEHLASSLKFHTSRTAFELARLDGDVEISPERISADQALGPVVLTTRNRNITLERIAGELSVTNRNGTVDLTSSPPLGNVTVQNRNGSVSLTVPDHANFAVDAQTTDGSVNNDFSLPSRDQDLKATMNGTVGQGGSMIHIVTSQGDVSLKKATIAPLALQTPPVAPAPPVPPRSSVREHEGR